MNIAVDAMGGDNAPEVVVQGAIQASAESGIDITLVGDKGAISEELARHGDVTRRINVHHCEEIISMEEPPLRAVRRKKDSSINIAFDLLCRGDSDAVVSAGNSGATMAAGILTLGKIAHVERPALACIIPGNQGRVVLIDVGGNIDCRPLHILQFGIMASAFAINCLGMKDPKVGLLNIGIEPGKGNEQARLAYDLLQDSDLNFIGNVEGKDIFTGCVQIVVCDGFVGNVALKLAEGMALTVTKRMKEDMFSSLTNEEQSLIGDRFDGEYEKVLDYAKYGGVPILGINGVGIVCHGDSSPRAIKNAIVMAHDYTGKDLPDKIAVHLAGFKSG